MATLLDHVPIQSTLAKDMRDAMADSDEAIIDALDDLKNQAQG
ncbi:hypothetical protein [Pseudomonas fluorescens]|uniref:Uncharacterized protein n=1 Tax=Pseudomonas fluorescens TaxID=294 RepID=A0A5E6XPQ4_PSEFL|nr:hypothetical protein [Pseudomonas fluorescens]VVN42744.1 hypothetical protein PS655_05551 [Pseudomonas fluorescens]